MSGGSSTAVVPLSLSSKFASPTSHATLSPPLYGPLTLSYTRVPLAVSPGSSVTSSKAANPSSPSTVNWTKSLVVSPPVFSTA